MFMDGIEAVLLPLFDALFLGDEDSSILGLLGTGSASSAPESPNLRFFVALPFKSAGPEGTGGE
jgi:hypothetical protein